MTDLRYVSIASGSGTQDPLFSAPLSVVLAAVTGDTSALLQYFNRRVFDAENALPEGERVEATITGWTVPGIGSVGPEVAQWLNQEWAAHKILDPTHPTEQIPAWPEFPDAIASYDSSRDELVLRYRKGQPFFVWIIFAVLAFLGLRAVLQSVGLWNGNYLYSLLGVTPTSQTGQPAQPAGMPVWEKILLIGGAGLALTGLVVFEGRLAIAKAGASRSSQEIIVER